MKGRLVVSPEARTDLVDIWRYLGGLSSRATGRVMQEIRARFQMLIDYRAIISGRGFYSRPKSSIFFQVLIERRAWVLIWPASPGRSTRRASGTVVASITRSRIPIHAGALAETRRHAKATGQCSKAAALAGCQARLSRQVSHKRP